MADAADFRGGGGGVMTFDLPMHEVYANQLLKGDLEPVDEAAREYLRSLRPEPEPVTEQPEPEPEPEPVPVPSEPPPRAGPGSARGNWAAWAEGRVEVSDEDTRDDIIAKLDGATDDEE